MANIKLVLEYEGTEFHGFQVQPGVRTVQGTIEPLLEELLAEKVRLTAAGRTDEGVHAMGQVVNFKTGSRMAPNVLKRALNARLPSDIAVRSAEDVPLDFHSRYSARSRSYMYRITAARSPFLVRYAWQVKYRLDFSRMKDAASAFLGEHDFSSFCVAKSRVDEPVCVVYSSVWRKEGDILTYEIEANRFLHNMVRIMVGSMVELGRGKIEEEDLARMLSARDRTAGGPTAPPQGLFLVEVKY